MSSLSAPSNASDFAAPTPASVQSTNSADMGSVLSPITVQTQQNLLPAPSGATPECGRSTPLASRPTSFNSIDQQIKQIQEEIRALHDAVRALPSTSRMSSSQKQPHVLYGLQRRLETMKYCLHHGVRDDDLDSYMPRAIRKNVTNDWNAFKTSRFFHCLVEKDGLEGERGVCLSSSSRDRSFWHFKTLLYASLTHKLITLYPYKVSKDFSTLNTIGSRYWEKVKDSPDLYEQWKEAWASEAEAREHEQTTRPFKRWRIDPAAITKLSHKYEKTIHELVNQHADTYGFDALVIVGSNKLENKNDRFIVSTLGGAAFMRRQSWGSQKNDVLVNFTECINGTRFNQERDEQFKMEAHRGDVDKASHRVLCTWYRIIIDDYYNQALRRRHNRNKSIQPYVPSKLTSYNQETLAKDPTALVIELGNGLHERDFRSPTNGKKPTVDDFRSPTNGKKPTVDDLRRIIPLMRQGGLTFSLKEDIGQVSFDRTPAESTLMSEQSETEPEDQDTGSDSGSDSDLGAATF